jgi:hypothetical protein
MTGRHRHIRELAARLAGQGFPSLAHAMDAVSNMGLAHGSKAVDTAQAMEDEASKDPICFSETE